MRLLALALVLAVTAGCIEVSLPGPSARTNDPSPTDADPDPSRSATSRPTPANRPPTSTGPRPAPLAGPAAAANATPVDPEPVGERPHVTVATFDTGLNPFHPTWRTGRDPRLDLPAIPADTVPVRLTFGGSFDEGWQASSGEWAKLQGHAGLVLFEGTRTMAVAEPDDPTPVLDRVGDAHSHGARASTQVAGTGYAVADHAYVVAFDHTGGEDSYEPFFRKHVDWLIAQEWIDVVHINFGFPTPYPVDSVATDLGRLVASGKIVVLPALNGVGNGGVPYPMEFGQLAHVPGTLVAGANDQCAAGAHWSDLNPHVVMDGDGTVAGESLGYGDAGFGGTSSSSPRTAGYVAEVLYQLRLALNRTTSMSNGALVELPVAMTPPSQGPLADGRLLAAELHEVVRKTARPPHDSWMDGSPLVSPCPPFPAAGEATYAKVGYGEVSDVTLPDAVAVLLGLAPMPERAEDAAYERSEQLRATVTALPV